MSKSLIKWVITVLYTLLNLHFIVNATQARIIHKKKSLYHDIIVDETPSKRCLKFQISQANYSNQSCILTDNKNQFAFEYSKLIMGALLINPNPSSVLVVGLGAGTIPTALSQAFPKAKITTVELDPAVLEVAQEFFDFKLTQNMQVKLMDARVYIKKVFREKSESFDLIILDAFSGQYIPQHLMTKEFLYETRSVCSHNCVIAANTFSSSKLAKYEAATYLDVFKSFVLLKSNTANNRIILTSNNLQILSGKHIIRNKERSKKALSLFNINPEYILQHFSKINGPAVEQFILSDNFSPVNLLKK